MLAVERPDPCLDEFKLRVAVRRRRTFARLAIGWQAESVRLEQRGEQRGDRAIREVVFLPSQFLGEFGGALARPQPRRLGRAARDRFHQREQRTKQLRIGLGDGLPPAPTHRKRSDTAARGDFRRRFRSHRPTATVLRASPVAATPAETPPPPKPIASAAAHCRRTRSSITGANLVHHGSQRRVFLPLPFDRG